MSGAAIATTALVGRTLSVFARSFGALAALAIVSLAALVALATIAFVTTGALDGSTAAGDPSEGVVIAALWSGITAVQIGAVTSLTLGRLRGERTTVWAAIGAGARRLVPVGMASGLCLAAVAAGVAVLVAPGLVALASLAVAPAAAAHERGGPFRALVRSLDLTRGCRGRVFGAVAIVGAVAVALLLALLAACAAVEPVAGETPAGFGAIFSCMLVVPLPTIASAVVYEALREAKESPRAAELQRVFG